MGRCWRLSQRSPTPPTAWIRVACCVRVCVVFCCLWMSSARLRPFRVLSGSGDDGAAPGDAAVACGAARQATAAAFRVLARGLGPGIDVTMKEEMTRCARIIIIIVIIARARVSIFSLHLSMKNWREPRDGTYSTQMAVRPRQGESWRERRRTGGEGESCLRRFGEREALRLSRRRRDRSSRPWSSPCSRRLRSSSLLSPASRPRLRSLPSVRACLSRSERSFPDLLSFLAFSFLFRFSSFLRRFSSLRSSLSLRLFRLLLGSFLSPCLALVVVVVRSPGASSHSSRDSPVSGRPRPVRRSASPPSPSPSPLADREVVGRSAASVWCCGALCQQRRSHVHAWGWVLGVGKKGFAREESVPANDDGGQSLEGGGMREEARTGQSRGPQRVRRRKRHARCCRVG
jgi:hypothetical protein